MSRIALALIPFSMAYAADPAPSMAPAGWKTYDSTADSARPDLKSHSVGFRFNYPETFKLNRQQEGIFVVASKYGPNGKDLADSFTVSWFEADDPNSNKDSAAALEKLGEEWAKQQPNVNTKTISYTTRKIDGVMASGATWEFTTRDSPPLFFAAAASYFIHQPGKTKGVRIDQYGTWVDPQLKSAANLGRNDDLARMLSSFKFLPENNESGAKPPATATTPSDSQVMTAEDQKALITAAIKWLELLDAGNYAENFAAASASFRKGLTVEAWGKNHASMQKQFGPVKDRNDNVSITTRTESEDGKETVTRAIKINTTFAKTAGLETVTMTKESGVWKVADYSITTKSE